MLIHSQLSQPKTIPNSRYLSFLGDFVDRGIYGVEVLYVLMQLKIKNPDHVFLVRGNHEDINLNAGDPSTSGGFAQEVIFKFGKSQADALLPLINRFYNQLPLALFVSDGKSSIQCCHGGIDLHHNNRPFIEDSTPEICFDLIPQVQHSPTAIFPYLSEAVRENLVNTIIKKNVSYLYDTIVNALNMMIRSGNNIIKSLESQFFYFQETYKHKMQGLNMRNPELMHTTSLIKKYYIEFQEENNEYRFLLKPSYCGNVPKLYARAVNIDTIRKKLCASFLDAINLYKRELLINDELRRAFDETTLEQKCENVLKKSESCIMDNFNIYSTHKSNLDYQTSPFASDNIKQMLHKIILQPDSANIVDIAAHLQLKPYLLEPIFSEGSLLACLSTRNQGTCLQDYGYAWNDFILNSEQTITCDDGRWAFGCNITHETLALQGVKAIFRAHQHYGEMADLLKEHNGITALWDYDNDCDILALSEGLVCTFQVAPSSGMTEGLDYDPCGLLTITGDDFSKWTLEKIRVPRTTR